MKKFTPGLLLQPSSARRTQRLSLAAIGTEIIVPAQLSARSRLLQSSDQGNTSECVCYAIAGDIEFRNWKRPGGIPSQVNPHPMYVRAKELDGMPHEEGTTLEAGLQAAQDLGLMSAVNPNSIREISTAVEVQKALHLYDVMVAGFQITEGWMDATPDGWIRPGGNVIGGHAVLLSGYYLNPPDSEGYYEFQGSWNDKQGWRGFNRISLTQLAQEFRYGLVWGS